MASLTGTSSSLFWLYILVLYFTGKCLSFEIPDHLAKPEIHPHRGRNQEASEKEADVSEERWYHLPDTLYPISYHLKIIPNLVDFTFEGDAKILINIVNDTNKIVLNSLALNFNKSSVNVFFEESPTGQISSLAISDLVFDNLTEQVTITTETNLRAEVNYLVAIKYSGDMTDSMLGFYRSWYKKDGELRWLGTTQMESTYARRVFPSFDEPRFRTNFTLEIAREKNQKTISNMPVVVTSLPDPAVGNKVWDKYFPTPAMATYLVAFCIFDFVETTEGQASVWSVPGSESQAEYIVKEVPTILEVMKNFTGIPYSLPKLDLVAVPDFNAGAMENWGLTTYREKYLLYEPNVSTTLDRQWILTIVAHELAHQWFGDLVTPVWWDYTWLNEAFATYFEYYTPSLMEPTWRLMDQFVIREVHYALSNDIGGGHPINGNVSTPSEIDSIFDVFSYSKGGSVLRMMQHFLGMDNYKKGIQYYLKHGVSDSQGTVKPKNLWDAYKATLPVGTIPEGVSIETIMSTWVDQKGFPLLTVTRDNNTVYIKQTAFTRDSTNEYNDNLDEINSEDDDNVQSKGIEGQQWWVPLTYTTDEELNFTNTYPRKWLRPNETFEININSAEWILLNIQQTGYYRVNYDLSMWEKLREQLSTDHRSIHPVNRAQLLDDAFTFASLEKTNYTLPLVLASYLENEHDYIPWYTAIKHFAPLLNRYYGTEVGTRLEEYLKKLIHPIYQRLASIAPENRNYTDILSVNAISIQACASGLEHCEKNSNQHFKSWIQSVKDGSNNYILDPDTKYAILCTGLKYANRSEFDILWEHYRNTSVSTEKSLILQTVGCVSNLTILHDFFHKLLETQPAEIRSQDIFLTFRSVASRKPNGVKMALQVVCGHFQQFVQVLKPKYVRAFFSYFGNTITNETDRLKLEKFYKTNEQDLIKLGLAKVINASLQAIDRNKAWRDKHQQVILSYLQTEQGTTPGTTAGTTPGAGTTSGGGSPGTGSTAPPGTHPQTSATTAKPSGSWQNEPNLIFLLFIVMASCSHFLS